MSEENIALVRRWYAAFPDLRDKDRAEDRETFGRIVPDYLDKAFELRLPGDYPEGEPPFRRRRDHKNPLGLGDAGNLYRALGTVPSGGPSHYLLVEVTRYSGSAAALAYARNKLKGEILGHGGR